MLSLESYVHREDLAEILTRWMLDRPAPGDVAKLKAIINFNSYLARVWLDRLTREILAAFQSLPAQRYAVRTKGQLKDFVVEHPRYSSVRIEEMLGRYRRFPEDFYRDTPIDGWLYVIDCRTELAFVGASRIKRFRRIAEKGSRRIVDYMLGRIRANADVLAEERARSQGISKDQLITPKDMMVEEFNHAERRVLKSIRQGTIEKELPVLAIPDVVGMKLIVEDDEYERFRAILEKNTSCRIVEEERHMGNYKGINLRVSHRLDKELLLTLPPPDTHADALAFCGFDRADIPRRYREFVSSAEDEVRLEVIVANFQEFLESEIGRSMHEERVQFQRSHREYNGHLATNVRYLMEFIFALCQAPATVDYTDLPIKLWVKYMPDTLEREVRHLYLPDRLTFEPDGSSHPLPASPFD